MEGNSKKLLICVTTVVFLVMFIGIADAVQGRIARTGPIKCYQCNSFYDKGCSDFFDNRTYPLIPCKDNVTMCRKIIQEVYYDGHWDVRYIRQCARWGEIGPAEGRWCQERTSNYRARVKVCHCNNKDGCNTASEIGSSLSNIMILVLLTMVSWTCMTWSKH